MTNVFFTSDLHFYQRNIIKSLSNWSHADEKSLRLHESVEDMNEDLIYQINRTVDAKATLYILGDLIFSKDINDLKYIFSQIKCKNIHLILGNHDQLILKHYESCLRIFKTINTRLEIKVRYPLPGIDPNREKWEGTQRIVLSHYAMRVWNQSHRDSWMLYGHSHCSLDCIKHSNPEAQAVNDYYQKRLTMDVGVNNAFQILGEYRPFSFEELQHILKDRSTLYIDHHEKS